MILPQKNFQSKNGHFRSAIIPGWGQAYNKKVLENSNRLWSIGNNSRYFLYNLKKYKLLRKAVVLHSDTIPGNDSQVDPRFSRLSLESIRTTKSFRQNVDYSVLFFLVFWGLNVVDATVDAHLKGF